MEAGEKPVKQLHPVIEEMLAEWEQKLEVMAERERNEQLPADGYFADVQGD